MPAVSSGYSATRGTRVARSQPTPLFSRNSGTRAAVVRSTVESSGSVHSRSAAVGVGGPGERTRASALRTSELW